MSKRKKKANLDDQSVVLLTGGIGSLMSIFGAFGYLADHVFSDPGGWFPRICVLAFVLGAIVTVASAFSLVAVQEQTPRKSKVKTR